MSRFNVMPRAECNHLWINLCVGATVHTGVYWRVDICVHCGLKWEIIP